MIALGRLLLLLFLGGLTFSCRSTADSHWRDRVRIEVSGSGSAVIAQYWETTSTMAQAGRVAPLTPALPGQPPTELDTLLTQNAVTVQLPWFDQQVVAHGDVLHLRVSGPDGIAAVIIQGSYPVASGRVVVKPEMKTNPVLDLVAVF